MILDSILVPYYFWNGENIYDMSTFFTSLIVIFIVFLVTNSLVVLSTLYNGLYKRNQKSIKLMNLTLLVGIITLGSLLIYMGISMVQALRNYGDTHSFPSEYTAIVVVIFENQFTVAAIICVVMGIYLARKYENESVTLPTVIGKEVPMQPVTYQSINA